MLHCKKRWTALFTGLFLIACVVAAAPAAASDRPLLNIVFLIDNSGSIAQLVATGPASTEPQKETPTDPESKRVRFARFLIRYLQAFQPDTRVGMASFAGSVSETTPLLPAEQWTTAELMKITGTVQGGYTRFLPALDQARQMLTPRLPACKSGTELCHILILTDGQLETQETGEDQTKLQQKLLALKGDGIRSTVVLFAGNPPAREDYKTDKEWVEASKKWQEPWDKAKNDWSPATTVFPFNATTEKADVIYGEILQNLVLPKPPLVVEVDQEKTISLLTIPPFRQSLQLYLLPDGVITETWSTAPTVRAGMERWWINPPVGPLELTLIPQITPTLVYYSPTFQVYPITLEAQVVPDRQEVGRPVELQAWFTLGGGQIITQTAGFNVTASLGATQTYTLTAGPEGRFTYILTNTLDGDYRLKFSGMAPTGLGLPPVPDVEREFRAGRVPRLKLFTSSPVAAVLPITLAITVTVENSDVIRGIYTPTLEISESHTLIPLSSRKEEIFTGDMTVITDSHMTLRASLPRGWTNKEIPFSPQPVDQFLQVGRIPQLTLDIGAIVAGDPPHVPVTVTVANYDTIAGIYTPTLYVTTLGPVPITWNGGEVFRAIVPISDELTFIHAVLPAGNTHSGLSFVFQERKITVSHRVERSWFWAPIGLLVGGSLGTAAGAGGIIAIQRRRRGRETMLAAKILENPENNDGWDQLAAKGMDAAWQDIEHLADQFAEEYRDSRRASS